MKPTYFFLTLTFLFGVLDVVVLVRLYALLGRHAKPAGFAGIAGGVVGRGGRFLRCVAFLQSLSRGHSRSVSPGRLSRGFISGIFCFCRSWLWGCCRKSRFDGLAASGGGFGGRTRRRIRCLQHRRLGYHAGNFWRRRRWWRRRWARRVCRGVGISQTGKFRLRFYDLSIATWPAALDNYSITVIADVHVGVFSTQRMLEDIVEASNRLRSDLVLLPGDLINIAVSDIPAALDMVLRLDSRDGVYLIEGNHDVAEGAERFDRRGSPAGGESSDG